MNTSNGESDGEVPSQSKTGLEGEGITDAKVRALYELLKDATAKAASTTAELERLQSRCTTLEQTIYSKSELASKNADAVATSVAQVDSLKTQAEAALDLAVKARGHVETLSGEIAGVSETVKGHLATVNDHSSAVLQQRTKVDQDAGVAAQRSAHIEDGRVYVDKKRAEIDRLLTAAQQAATGAEGQLTACKTTAQGASDQLTSIQQAKSSVEASASAVAESLRITETSAATAKKLADVAKITEDRIAAYEKSLESLQSKAEERLKTIDGLLPGAASTGLASAFNQRRSFFKWPQRAWQTVFIFSVFGLLAVATLRPSVDGGMEFSLLPHAVETTQPNVETGGTSMAEAGWKSLGFSLLARLPLALPLVWLAFHSSHKAALAQRLEEDYGFKEVVSRSFEGYRREMSELEGKVQPDSPLAKLCSGVLGVVTSPPGRIYEKHALNRTPLNALAESAKPVAKVAASLHKGS